MAAPMVTPPIGASLQRLAEQSWDRIASGSVLYYEDERWTGEQLAERIRRVAGGLIEAGLLPGERVVVCMANCPEVGITYAAIWRAGAVATPVLLGTGRRLFENLGDRTIQLEPARVVESPYATHLYFTVRR